ncbi:hypothetical protein LEP1GSC111_2827 [Leptospira interrogans str. UT126]|nr:hypothetical protein LEP1GSC111_2827 [Leptospira interrogans str. UT126]
MDLQLNFENCGNYYKIQNTKRIIVQSDFCTKPLFYGHH